MPELVAIYLDLHDLQSARVWRWLQALPRSGQIGEEVEVRPFSLEVDDPWACDAPPFGLELLMLLEQAREHGPEAINRVIGEAFARLGESGVESAHGELAAWLAIGAAAHLPLQEYDETMERLRAEVGYWMAEAREDHGVVRTPTLLFDDGTTVYIQLDTDVDDPVEAQRLMGLIRARLAAVGSGSVAG